MKNIFIKNIEKFKIWMSKKNQKIVYKKLKKSFM